MPKRPVPEHYQGLTRRQMLAGAGGFALAGQAIAGGHAASLDLDSPRGNMTALLKLQADLSGADLIRVQPPSTP